MNNTIPIADDNTIESQKRKENIEILSDKMIEENLEAFTELEK